MGTSPVNLVPYVSVSFLSFRDLSIFPAKYVAVSKTKTNGASMIKPVIGVGSGPNIQKSNRIPI